MKKPELQDFGITPEEYARHQQLSRKSSTDSSEYAGAGCFLTLFVVAPIVGIIVFFVTSDWDRAFSWAIWSVIIGGIPGMLISYFFYGVSEAFKRHQKSRILQSPLGIQIRQYEEAIAAYEDAVKEAERKRLEIQREAEYARQAAERARQAADRAERRKRIDHWQAVRGIQFERELAALYRHLGYDVQSTPKSGDQGIDLILRKGGSTTIVQCKGQKGPASPAVVRELYGSFAAFQGAQHAILACNGGFTQGVYEFAIGKPNSPHLSKRDSPHGRRLFTTSTRASVDAEKPCAKTVNRPEMSSLWASDDLVRQILAVLRIPQL